MKRKILISIIGLVLAAICIAQPVQAALSGNVLCKDPQYCLDDNELTALNNKLEEISERQRCEICIYTTDTLDGKTATEYADDYFDYGGYGYGSDHSGILLLIDVKSREWAISTTGYGIQAFTDAGLNYITDRIIPYMSEGDYNGAFNLFAELCDDFLTQAYTGKPYDVGNLPEEKKDIALPIDIGIGGVLGVLASFFVVGADKAALKTVRRKAQARSYMRKGSLLMNEQHEKFLYSNVETIALEKESSGGSSTHTGSSGTTHGGSSGSF